VQAFQRWFVDTPLRRINPRTANCESSVQALAQLSPRDRRRFAQVFADPNDLSRCHLLTEKFYRRFFVK